MVIALSGFVGTDAGGRRALALDRAVNEVLSAHGLPLSGFSFGQTASQEAIHEALNEALMRNRLVVTPTHPEYAWLIYVEVFARVAEEVVTATRSMGFAVTLQEAEEALIARGYKPGGDPPIYTDPAVEVPVVIVTPTVQPIPQPEPVYRPPPVQTVIRQPVPEPERIYEIQPVEPPEQRWQPLPTYDVPTEEVAPLPAVYTPVIPVIEEEAAIDTNTLLMIVGGVIGGLALASMMKRGR